MKILLMLPFLSGCAMLAGQAGLSAQAIQIAQIADYAKTGADVGSYLATGRSLVDNAISSAVGKDCKLTRLLDGEYCVEIAKDDDPHAD